MKNRYNMLKVFISIIVLLITAAGITTPTYAWKVKTHVYSANLLMEEIKANDGYVEIEPFGKFQVLPEYRSALQNYPEYYRAGAMGPDLIPDILVGQTKIHTGTSVFSSGEIIENLWDAVEDLPDNPTAPAGDPAANYLRINNKQQAMAFVLGCMGHACGDYFGHSYINSEDWAGGPWPDLMDGISQKDMSIITRHNVMEAYIDSKIPDKYKTLEYNTIKIPQQFVFYNMVARGSVNLKVLANDTREAESLGLKADVPAHLKVFFDIRTVLRNRIAEIDRNMSGNAFNVIASGLSLEFAQKAYMKAWISDIDSGLGAWVAANEKAAQQMVTDGGMTKYKDELKKWSDDHLLKMLGAPDVAADITKKLGNVADFVEGLLPAAIKTQISAMKLDFINTLFKWSFNMDLNQFLSLGNDPESLLNNTQIFENGSLAKLNSQMGNFNSCTKAVDQTFVPFSNTLVMMKLTLIGDSGLADLRKRSGSKDTYKLPLGVDTITEFIDSFDVGYYWSEQKLYRFLFWQYADDRNKISKVIFNLNGTTTRPVFSNMTQGPVTALPAPRPAGAASNITISFSNAPAQVNAVIGLYPADDFNAQEISWKYTGAHTSGEYTVTAPYTSGKYHFRIYDNDNNLISVSDSIEVIIDQSSADKSYFSGITAQTMEPGQSISYEFINNLKKKGFFGLYKVEETDPQKFVMRKHTLNGITTIISVSQNVPTIPGRYQYRAYDENMVLFAESSIITISGAAGTTNSTGAAGATNSTGAAGATNSTGAAGTTNSTGTAGTTNSTGTAGATNSTGTTSTNEVSASPEKDYGIIVLILGNRYMKVNGELAEIDKGIGTVPETNDGRTCLPIRAVAEAMGAKVSWDSVQKKVTLIRGDITVELWIGKKIAKVNGKEQSIDVAPYTSKTGRTMIPLRFAGESLGGVITWDSDTKAATIVYSRTDISISHDEQNVSPN